MRDVIWFYVAEAAAGFLMRLMSLTVYVSPVYALACWFAGQGLEAGIRSGRLIRSKRQDAGTADGGPLWVDCWADDGGREP